MSDGKHARLLLEIARRDLKALEGMLEYSFFDDADLSPV